MNMNSSLIPVYTIHLPTVHVRTKFQPSRPHSSWEKCDEKISMFENWKLERKKNEKTTAGVYKTLCPQQLAPNSK